jgi:hypothetical protein
MMFLVADDSRTVRMYRAMNQDSLDFLEHFAQWNLLLHPPHNGDRHLVQLGNFEFG